MHVEKTVPILRKTTCLFVFPESLPRPKRCLPKACKPLSFTFVYVTKVKNVNVAARRMPVPSFFMQRPKVTNRGRVRQTRKQTSTSAASAKPILHLPLHRLQKRTCAIVLSLSSPTFGNHYPVFTTKIWRCITN